MIYQTFSRYYRLSLDSKVAPILCGLDESHGILVPNMDEFDTIFLYCLECKYKKIAGLALYDSIRKTLENMPVEPLDAHEELND